MLHSLPMTPHFTRRQFAVGLSGGLVGGIACAQNAPRIVIPKTNQLLLGIADGWGSRTAQLQAFDRTRKGWQPALSSNVRVLLGRNGMAWGRGAVPPPPGGTAKREGDGKAPAGYFRIGKVLGYAPALPNGSNRYPYHQVTRWDAWPDDVNNPWYNQHLVIDPKKGVPNWFESQKMRLGDYAYTWLIEIRHNADPKPVPGAGSAIFMHIRRGENRPTSGCTTMRQSDLETIIRWLRTDANPHYVLLPRAEYERLKAIWKLPAF